MNPIRYIGGQFGRPSGFGGVLSTWVMNRMNQKQYRAVVRALEIQPNDRVLDIGFGNGFLLQQIAENHRCQLYGTELSDDMLTLAAKRNRKPIADGAMQLRRGDVVRLNYGDGFFDRVYTVNTVYFWSDLHRGLSEIMRVLRPGGVFVNAFYSRDFLDRLRYTDYGFAKYAPAELRRAALQAGFAIEKMAELTPGAAYCLVLRKP